MNTTVYLNGEFVAEPQAVVSVFDGGWLHGAGLFETMRAHNGRIFRYESHVERLRRSAEKLLRPLERTQLPTESQVRELLERNGLDAARVRLTVTAGSMRGSTEESSDALTVCMTSFPLTAYPAKSYQEGIQVMICPFRQSADDPIAGHKTTGYLSRLLGLREAQKAHCLEAVWFTTRNQLAEGSISNVFVVQGGVLKTPALDTPVLPGVTRAAVLEVARKSGIKTEESHLGIGDLLDADECFLTNTIMELMPVIRIERKDIKDGKVGPMTRKLGEVYRNLVEDECGCPIPSRDGGR